MVQKINNPTTSSISASGGKPSRPPVVVNDYKYDRVSPPEDIVWLRIPNLVKLKKLFVNGELILPKFYRPGMYLNIIV